ncbi:MAG: polysaccharide pyruvyl transferase family protein [Gallionella sp.]|jgi:polysaccharide pyruvyl transferase WcaK-like protein/MoaA/NifB/PqqE/SkfB family radical SAM enzyme|nr:polysaccharide pyruvyl transferase family protein [Gallionella sp.]
MLELTNNLRAKYHWLRTILSDCRYLILQKPYPLEKPIVIQFPVIDICNSACQMCRIWENKKSDDITPDQLRHGLHNPLFSEVTSVGLNGGEPTLRKDLAVLVSVLFDKLPKLRSVSLITNAYNYHEVIERIGEVGEVIRAHGGYFDVMVSLDGYGEVHDRVRGKPGNFDHAQKVIDFALTSPLVHNVRIGCTIIKENVYDLANLLEFCQARGLYIKYRLGIPHQRLYTQSVVEPYSLSVEDKYHIAEFFEGLISHYETAEQQKFFYRSLIDQIIHNAPRKAGCDWQHRGATITSKGELLYCAVQSKVLGRITENDGEKIFFGNATHLEEIISSRCDNCYHDYVGLPPKRQYAKQLALRGLKKLGRYAFVHKLKVVLPRRWVLQRRFALRLEAFQKIETSSSLEPKLERSIKRVLICGWYGTETLGDKAILGGVIYALKQGLGEVEITLVSLFPYVSEQTCLQMTELDGAHVVEPREGIRLASGMDLVVFGGGPLMASIDQMAEMEVIFSAASRFGVPTLVAGCGVGPLGNKWHNESIRNVLLNATSRIYRDLKSRELAAGLGVDVTNDVVAEDPAFTWLKNQRAQLTAKPPTTRKVILLGLRDFPHLQYAGHLGKKQSLAAKQRFEREVIVALEQLVDQHEDLIIRPLPMCTNHFGDDDRWFYRRLLRNNVHLKNNLDLSLLGRELSPLEYCEAFRGANVALTMRFHSLVFALGLELPAIAIDYTLGKGKVMSLAARFAVPCQSLDEIDAKFIVAETNRLLRSPVAQAANFKPSFCDDLLDILPLQLRR